MTLAIFQSFGTEHSNIDRLKMIDSGNAAANPNLLRIVMEIPSGPQDGELFIFLSLDITSIVEKRVNVRIAEGFFSGSKSVGAENALWKY